MDTYEKKYNEAMLRADEAVQKGCLDKDMFDIIFPPEESEDERIRKALVWHLKADVDFVSNGVTKAECLAWLEKQKDIEERWFKDREGCFWDGVAEGRKQKENPDSFTDEHPNIIYTEMGEEFAKQKEQKPSIFPPGLGEVHWNPIPSGKDVHKWNLPEDFEEAVYKVANFISPFDSQEELRKVSHRFAEQLLDMAKKEQKPKNILTDDDSLQTAYLKGQTDVLEDPEAYGLQKEQKPTVTKPHKGDDGNPYDMGVSEAQEYAIKRGFGIPFNDGEVYVDERHITQTIGNILRWADDHPKEQKPVEWSEEDEKVLNYIIQYFTNYDFNNDEYYQDMSLNAFCKLKLDAINFLKSLRPQPNKK